MGHQPVVQQKISFLDHSHCFQRQQFRVSRPCSHQEHIPWPAFLFTTIFSTTSTSQSLLFKNMEQLSQLGQLQSDVVLSHGVSVRRKRARGGGERLVLKLVGVEPLVSLVSFYRMLFCEG
uniref:Uroporphyrinogen-III C-methyltransferase n=1 Tax=Rhizophora mucronata TaxID=61149 RepID=A0A2P2J7D9_RHIMU